MKEEAEGITSGEVDFSAFLHTLRTHELTRLPPGAKVVLSGGAAGIWYFDWFEQHYATPIERHIGVEALNPRPHDLPGHVQWIESSLGDLGAVAPESVDLVFAGEVIEHMWPDDIAGFLIGAHRVLRPGGKIALDSPNRRVTQAIKWLHPEHTVEFTVDEIVELLTLGGFDDVAVTGVLLSYDTEEHRFLGLDEIDDPKVRQWRVQSAHGRPEDSLIWWAHAVRGEREPDTHAVEARVQQLFAQFRAARFGRLLSAAGHVEETGHDGPVVRAQAGEAGTLLHGPYAPMPPGRWRATFELAFSGRRPLLDHTAVGFLDVVAETGTVQLGRIDIAAVDLDEAGRWTRLSVPFGLERTMAGLEFRLFSSGKAPLVARLGVEVRPEPPSSGDAKPSAGPRAIPRHVEGRPRSAVVSFLRAVWGRVRRRLSRIRFLRAARGRVRRRASR